jgi:chemotaxis protein CheD
MMPAAAVATAPPSRATERLGTGLAGVTSERIRAIKARPRSEYEAHAFYHDAAFRLDAVKLMPGEYFVHDADDLLLTTVLGSCVSVCLIDRVAHLGGMNHFMLPQPGTHSEASTGSWHGAAARLRYGNTAMADLLEQLQRLGGRLDRMEAKLFGAARLGVDQGMVGDGNARFAEAFLAKRGLPLRARELGGVWARRVAFQATTGRAFMTELREKAPVELATDDKPWGARHRGTKE